MLLGGGGCAAKRHSCSVWSRPQEKLWQVCSAGSHTHPPSYSSCAHHFFRGVCWCENGKGICGAGSPGALRHFASVVTSEQRIRSSAVLTQPSAPDCVGRQSHASARALLQLPAPQHNNASISIISIMVSVLNHSLSSSSEGSATNERIDPKVINEELYGSRSSHSQSCASRMSSGR